MQYFLISLLAVLSTSVLANTDQNIPNNDSIATLKAKSAIVALNLIKDFEQCSETPYYDSAGICTIGYGERCKGRKRLSCEKSEQNVMKYIQRDINVLEGYGFFKDEEFNANQMGAVLSMTFNVGVDYFMSTSQNITEKKYWLSLSKSGGRTLKGLHRRRLKEFEAFNRTE